MKLFKHVFLLLTLIIFGTALSASHYEPIDDDEAPACVRFCASSVAFPAACVDFTKTEEAYYFCCESNTSCCCLAQGLGIVCSCACIFSGFIAGAITSNYHCNNAILKLSMGIPCGLPGAYVAPNAACAAYRGCGKGCAMLTDNDEFLELVDKYELEHKKTFNQCHQSLFPEGNCTHLSTYDACCTKCLTGIFKPCCGEKRRREQPLDSGETDGQ